jgi:hypothetical protein
VPTVNNELALTKYSSLTMSGTIDSRDGCLVRENISEMKLIINSWIRVVVKNNPRTINILEISHIIIIFLLLNLSANIPANEDMKAGIIRAIIGTTEVNSELPPSAPK